MWHYHSLQKVRQESLQAPTEIEKCRACRAPLEWLCTTFIPVLLRGHNGCQIPWNWSGKGLWVTMWELFIETDFSGRTASSIIIIFFSLHAIEYQDFLFLYLQFSTHSLALAFPPLYSTKPVIALFCSLLLCSQCLEVFVWGSSGRTCFTMPNWSHCKYSLHVFTAYIHWIHP